MSHHDHGHGHAHPPATNDRDRLKKLLDHWMKHNEDHAKTYRQWAEKAREEGLEEVAALLAEAAAANLAVNGTFEKALESLEKAS